VAARIPDIVGNFYLAKNHKIAINLTTIEAQEKKYAGIWNP
jgi:hypothetical protein